MTRRRRFPWLGLARPPALALGIVTICAFVLVTGITTALTVPAVAITAQGGLQQMLPADTALYVSADVDPSGTARSELTGIGGQYTSQRGWASLVASFHGGPVGKRDPRCVNNTVGTATNHLSYLGHDAALALIPARPGGLIRSSNPVVHSFGRNLVVVAPLDVRLTLYDAISGFAFSTPKKAVHYHRVSIFREVIPSCVLPHSIKLQSYYAAVYKGYIIAALVPAAIERVIDAGAGRAPSLATSPAAARLNAQLPTSTVAGFYVNAHDLARPNGLLYRLRKTNLLPRVVIRGLRHAGRMEGAATVANGSLSLSVAVPSSYPPFFTAPAPGRLAASLPNRVKLYASSRGMKPQIGAALAWIHGLGVSSPVLNAARRTLHEVNGEADLVQTGNRRVGGLLTSPHWVWYWQSRQTARTLRSSVKVSTKELGFYRLPEPAMLPYSVTSVGRGFVLGSGWAVMSSSPASGASIVESNAATPLASLPEFPAATTRESQRTGVGYFDVRHSRGEIDRVLRGLPWPKGTKLRKYVHLLTGPIGSLSATVQRTRPGHVTVVDITATFPGAATVESPQ